MDKKNAIPRDPDLPKNLDFNYLRKEGIAYLQKLSGDLWTDYNDHDPGVTILEQICYALTDVAYRTRIDIEKLLFYNSKDKKKKAQENALFAPDEIFKCSPTTINDYRILIIDRIKEVNNVWLYPVENDTFGITGLYDIVLQLENETHIDEGDIISRISQIFADNRNLCEDINEIKILQQVPMSIAAEIEVSADAIGEEVLSELFNRIDNYFNPPVEFQSFEDLIKQGDDLSDIFEMPSYTHGFIKVSKLHHKQYEFYISKIAELISSIPGVRNVKDLIILKNGIRIYGDSIKIDEGTFASLNIDKSTSGKKYLNVIKGSISYDYDQSLVNHLYEVKQAKQKRSFEVKWEWQEEKSDTNFNVEEIADFPSIQNSFPIVYGIGKAGLPKNASKQRKAKARQLKAYLLLMDQVMSNHLAQLKNIHNIFSVDGKVSQSYYGQLPIDCIGLVDLIHAKEEKETLSEKDIQGIISEFSERMKIIMIGFDDFRERKNRILNHLMARFAERYAYDLQGKVKTLFGEVSDDEIQQQLIETKVKMLEQIVHISRDRAKGYNYQIPAWDTKNVPVFKKKVSLLLNIKLEQQRSLVDNYSNLKINIKAPGSVDIQEQHSKKGNYKYTTASDTDVGQFKFLIKGKRVIEYLLKNGTIRQNYKIQSEDDHYIILLSVEKNESPTKVCQVDSEESGKSTIDALISYFKNLNNDGEGFHTIEHVLLRPSNVDEYHFIIKDAQNRKLLKSITPLDIDKQRNIVENIIILGGDRINYHRAEISPGMHQLFIKNKEGNNIAKLVNTQASEEHAVKIINDLVKYFKVIDTTGDALRKSLEWEKLPFEGSNIGKDFYNSRISLVLPNWVSRFQNDEFKVMLKLAVLQSIPAHIGVNFVWLGIKEMREFEVIYKKWLLEREQIDFNRKDLDKLSNKLITYLCNDEDL